MKKIKLYDSVTQTKITLDNPPITIYNCGPTVYNHTHIGNLRPALTFDFLIRFLKAINIPVIYVHNLTDIDDKIINQALISKTSEKKIAEKYIQAYLEVMQKMHILEPDFMPKVSDNIPEIITYIQKMVDNQSAYLSGEDVFFHINKIPEYGMVSKQKIDALKTNSRELQSGLKSNELDFVLWKKTDVGLNWPTTWNSSGRPGWHTECSFFINKYVGEQVTIHGGGMDLKFPHHENENAQNLALFQKPIAKIWMHVGTITVGGEKMSKSLNNFVLTKTILERYQPNAIRWFFLQTHYTNPLDFEWSKLDLAQKELETFYRTINLARTHLILHKKTWKTNEQPILDSQIQTHFADNLNFANALSTLYEIKNNLNKAIKTNTLATVGQLLKSLTGSLSILGFVLPNVHDSLTIEMLNKWNQLIQSKQYQAADLIRAQLIQKNAL